MPEADVAPISLELEQAGRQSDAAAMTLVARGDTEAFGKIVERHAGAVHALSWRLLGDAVEAEDVVQDTFTKLWVGAARWTPIGGGLGGWLRRVATNACLDRLRRHRPVADAAASELVDAGPLADAAFDETRRSRAVAAAILALPDKQRAAIVLTYHEGLANADAAAVLGVGVKALESLLVRARQSLSRKLAEYGGHREGEL